MWYLCPTLSSALNVNNDVSSHPPFFIERAVLNNIWTRKKNGYSCDDNKWQNVLSDWAFHATCGIWSDKNFSTQLGAWWRWRQQSTYIHWCWKHVPNKTFKGSFSLVATTPKQFSPRCSKTGSQRVKLLQLSLSSSFPLILANKFRHTTSTEGRVSFQILEVRGLV